MVVLDEKLLRKRSEHNEGLLCELEEVALHQEEIEKIENIGFLCKHIKILLLQNNIISKIENLNKLKELEYLNLALNNISRIEGLERCESLKKLDLTVNFIDFDEFETSLSNLSSNYNLEDLYLVGNPVQSQLDKSKYRLFVITLLPQLKQLDGTVITSTERIAANSNFSGVHKEVTQLAASVSQRKRSGTYDSFSSGSYTRQSRVDMYREIGEQKSAQKRSTEVVPKPPKTVLSVLNAKGEIRQCNEGNYAFKLDEWSEPNCVLFELAVPRFMDSSLIDLDLNPTYVRCVVRGKVTQIRFDNEIRVSESKMQRIKSTGRIVCTCPFDRPVVRLFSLPSVADAPPPLETFLHQLSPVTDR